ncbi:AI-2E family transporter, partial [Staphylococcus pseudintermedius]
LYYLFNPVINLMERYNINRIWGITILFLGIIGMITIAVNLLIPIVSFQFDRLMDNFPNYLNKLTSFANNMMHIPFLSDYYSQIEK